MLEDDLVLSPCFYSYLLNARAAYGAQPSVCRLLAADGRAVLPEQGLPDAAGERTAALPQQGRRLVGFHAAPGGVARLSRVVRREVARVGPYDPTSALPPDFLPSEWYNTLRRQGKADTMWTIWHIAHSVNRSLATLVPAFSQPLAIVAGSQPSVHGNPGDRRLNALERAAALRAAADDEQRYHANGSLKVSSGDVRRRRRRSSSRRTPRFIFEGLLGDDIAPGSNRTAAAACAGSDVVGAGAMPSALTLFGLHGQLIERGEVSMSRGLLRGRALISIRARLGCQCSEERREGDEGARDRRRLLDRHKVRRIRRLELVGRRKDLLEPLVSFLALCGPRLSLRRRAALVYQQQRHGEDAAPLPVARVVAGTNGRAAVPSLVNGCRRAAHRRCRALLAERLLRLSSAQLRGARFTRRRRRAASGLSCPSPPAATLSERLDAVRAKRHENLHATSAPADSQPSNDDGATAAARCPLYSARFAARRLS